MGPFQPPCAFLVPLGNIDHAFGNVLVSEISHKVVKIDGLWRQVVPEELLKVDVVSLAHLVLHCIGISEILPLISVGIVSTTGLRHALMGRNRFSVHLLHGGSTNICT